METQKKPMQKAPRRARLLSRHSRLTRSIAAPGIWEEGSEEGAESVRKRTETQTSLCFVGLGRGALLWLDQCALHSHWHRELAARHIVEKWIHAFLLSLTIHKE